MNELIIDKSITALPVMRLSQSVLCLSWHALLHCSTCLHCGHGVRVTFKERPHS